MKRIFSMGVMGLALLASAACAPHPYYVSRVPPPPPRTAYMGVAPGPGFVWVDGFWAARPGGWRWVPGHWVRPPRPRAVWVPGYWAPRPRGWVWTRGYWR